MTREEAIRVLDPKTTFEALTEIEYYHGFYGREAKEEAVNESCVFAVAALREQEERSKGCGYCDIAKANQGVMNTCLHVKDPETNKWTMMGKKLIFCPMCGRKLEVEG